LAKDEAPGIDNARRLAIDPDTVGRASDLAGMGFTSATAEASKVIRAWSCRLPAYPISVSAPGRLESLAEPIADGPLRVLTCR
jgi:hypothetical protein